MSEFQPIRTLPDLSAQDPADMADGYRAGYAGAPEPGSDKSRSYWHGWRNGRADAGLAALDEAQRELAHAYVAQQRAH